jgi:hypothetical protein
MNIGLWTFFIPEFDLGLHISIDKLLGDAKEVRHATTGTFYLHE